VVNVTTLGRDDLVYVRGCDTRRCAVGVIEWVTVDLIGVRLGSDLRACDGEDLFGRAGTLLSLPPWRLETLQW